MRVKYVINIKVVCTNFLGILIDSWILGLMIKLSTCSELLGQHASSWAASDMLNHIDVANDDSVVFLELLELFWVVGSSGSVRHHNGVVALAVQKVEHIGAHSLNLVSV